MTPPNVNASNDPHRGVIFLLGLSGSGKGTVGKRLLEDGLTFAHLSMGEMLRGLIAMMQQNPNSRASVEALLEGDSPTPGFTKLDWLKHCVEKGLLVPNAWTQGIIEHQLQFRSYLSEKPWSIDGYPRKIGAARHLLEALSRARIPVWAVVHLQTSEQEAMRRLLARGRADDTSEAIQERFGFFRENVIPTLEYLVGSLGADRVLHLEAEGSSDEVYARVRNRLLRL